MERLVCVASILLLLACPAVVTSAADAPEVRAALGAEEIFVGETVDYQVEIRNCKNPPAPDITEIKELFDVVSRGSQSRNQQSITIVGGRVAETSVLSQLYHYQLTPRESGHLTIPPARATIDGTTYAGPKLSLRVATPDEQDHVLLEIKTSHTRVYPTQPFTISLRVFVKPLPNSPKTDPLAPLRRDPPHLQANWIDTPDGLTTNEKSNWLQSLLSHDGVGFTVNDVSARAGGFFERPAVLGLLKGREDRDGLDGSSIRYFVYELTRTFVPERTGEYLFGPAVVKGIFVTGMERGDYKGGRLVAIAPAVAVDVREVPSPRPAGYCGGIGEYRVGASANPTTLRVGDPLTLTLEFERGEHSGSLELVSAPDLSTIPELTEAFDLIDKNPTGRVEGSVKKFAYAMRPRKPSVSIPSLSVTTFDPQTERFTGVITDPILLSVTEASSLTAGELVGALPSSASAEIKTRAQGIYQNIINPLEVRDQRVDLVAWSTATGGIWCMAGCVAVAATYHRRKSSNSGWQRRQQARRTANRELSSARSAVAEGRSKDALRHVRSAIIGLIADMRNMVAEGLTASDVATLLSHRVPAKERDDVVQLLESIESAEYGGGPASEPAAVIDAASKLIGRIASHLERGG